MSRLAKRFAALRARNQKALLCFVTAGDPNPDLTVEIVAALDQAGADAVEIGIPFSDPLADGPSIQAASQRALQNGMTVVKSLEIIRRIRGKCPNLPLIPMTYYNPIRYYGLEHYAADAKAAGADAHIVTDLTPEEAEDWKRISDAQGLDTVFLLAPTSTPDRIRIVCQISSGFVYCVSRTGVTGAQTDFSGELRRMVTAIQAETTLPVCVGFGVSRPEHVAQIAAFADGVVVGTSLVNHIHQNREAPDLLEQIRTYVASLKAAT
jgi:tryptophan synthase alpha chain